MSTPLADLLRRVEQAPDGPKVAAVFDYDGTLIDGFSGVAYVTARARALKISPIEVARLVMAGLRGVRTPEEFDAFLDWSLQAYAGWELAELERWAHKIFDDKISARLRPESWALLEAHRAKGHTIIIASSATTLQIGPIAKVVEADHVACTQLEVVDGRVTGKVDGRPLWAEEKPRRVRTIAEAEGLDLERSFAYADGDEDTSLLDAVGHPVAVNPKPHMARVAEERGWPVLRGERTSTPPSVGSIVRTAAAFGGFVGGTAIAAGLGVLRRSRRTFVDTAMGFGSDLALTIAGVDVEIVEGRHHLWSSRPCVFIFNHRSNLDGLILMRVLREQTTAVAKQELRKVPGLGQLFALGGVAFIDRSDPTQIREALKPAVRALTEDGVSLALAPEGTRGRTPGMGKFKKGAFHIARQAGVPVVPIVIRGAGPLLPRGEPLIQPGRVEVVVLPPIDVTEWAAEELDERVVELREEMLTVLLDRG